MRLRSLEIENFALIRNASMTFADGLTVFTGETGSGKTMLLDALGFVLGSRASSDMVSAGGARMRVALRVEPTPDEDALLVREMSAAGKSSARINGRSATTAQLRAWGDRMVDIVGQHEQQRLLSSKYQLEMLDRFAGKIAIEARACVASLFARVRERTSALDEAQSDAARTYTEYEVAQRVLCDIDDAALQANEEIALRERRDYLANIERISGALALSYEALSGGENAVVEGLGVAVRALGTAARFSDSLRNMCENIVALQSDANEVAVALSRELDATERDPRELESIGARLAALSRHSQVLCISHLAQIASWADAHYVMRKRSEANETRIELHALPDAPVIREEIARMLSGNTADIALDHAKLLLDDARRAKTSAGTQVSRQGN